MRLPHYQLQGIEVKIMGNRSFTDEKALFSKLFCISLIFNLTASRGNHQKTSIFKFSHLDRQWSLVRMALRSHKLKFSEFNSFFVGGVFLRLSYLTSFLQMNGRATTHVCTPHSWIFSDIKSNKI